ncbi:MAG TPA: polysaccharide deacetylase family protein [Mycobacterium sp.]|nr:polysaccharide deacetylase family protein [Mycobacterium sp.]
MFLVLLLVRFAPVSELDRRKFMAGLAVAIVSGVGLARCELGAVPRVMAAAKEVAAPAPPQPFRLPGILPPPPPELRIKLPGRGTLWSLPGAGDTLALTLDDGVDTDVVRMYTQFAKDTGLRFTYFVNGRNHSWTDNKDFLRPLVDSGQIQLGNHTFSHPDLTMLTVKQAMDEISRNHDFLTNTYGTDARPYLRPPYGAHNSTVDAIAAGVGYTVMAMWSGDLGDSNLISESAIAKAADKFFTPQTVVIGHLNHPPVTHVYGHFVDLIRDRKLRSVTLNDIFERPTTLK